MSLPQMCSILRETGHLDGGGASTFLIVVPSMLPVYKKILEFR